MDYAFYLSLPCVIAALIGNYYINDYINRTNRKAFLLFYISGSCFVMLCILPFSSIYLAIFEISRGNSIFEFDTFCT